MINFSIKELNAFAVIGQEVELTNYQKKNIQIRACLKNILSCSF